MSKQFLSFALFAVLASTLLLAQDLTRQREQTSGNTLRSAIGNAVALSTEIAVSPTDLTPLKTYIDTARTAAAAAQARADAIPVYAGTFAVWPPNVRQHSDFQRTFQSTLSGLTNTLATDGGSTGTRFTNVFRILTRDADGDVVQLHTQGWAFTNDERQTIAWEVDAAEFNQLGTQSLTTGLEVWGEFRAVYGGGVDELRGRTNPVFIDFGEEDEWPARRSEIPEQRVLLDVSVPSAATRGKLVINDDLAYVTRAERDVTTPAAATFVDFTAADYVGAFDDDNVPDASANIGSWYWNTTRLAAFRSFRNNGGAVWTEADVNRLVTSGDYRGAWGTDADAIPHIQQIGDFYYLYFNALRRATAYTPPVHTHLRNEFRRLSTSNETDRRLEFIAQGSPSQIDKNNTPSAFNFLLTHKAGAFPEAATARIDFLGRQVLFPSYQPSIESRSLGWGVSNADQIRIAALTEGRSEDAVVRLLDADGVEIPGTVSQVDFTVVEGATGGGGGGTTDSTARAGVATNTAAISTLRTESRAGDDLQSITVATLSSLNSALSSQASAATPLEIVFSANVTRSGTTYDAGDVVYVMPRSTAIEARFNLRANAVDSTARTLAAGKEDAFTLSTADFRFAGQRVLSLSTARVDQLNRVPSGGGTANQVWAKGPSNEKADWRDQAGGATSGLTQAQRVGLLQFHAEPPSIRYEAGNLDTALTRTIRMRVSNAELLTGDAWVSGSVAGQPILARTRWTSTTSSLALPISAQIALAIEQNDANADSVSITLMFHDAASAGNQIGDTLTFPIGLIEQTASTAAGIADTTIGAAADLGASNAWSSYTITEDLERARYYQFSFRVGSATRFMRSSSFKGSDFLDLAVQTDTTGFTQGAENNVIGLSLPRPNIDGVRTLYIGRSSTAREILMRVADDYNVVNLVKLGGIPGPQGPPGSGTTDTTARAAAAAAQQTANSRLTQAQVDARIAPYARAAPTGQIADAQIPGTITRDSELSGYATTSALATVRATADAATTTAEATAIANARAAVTPSPVIIVSNIASYDATQDRFEDSSGAEVVVPNGVIVSLTQAVYDAAVADAGFTPNVNSIFLTR